jgi:hypothetical protein
MQMVERLRVLAQSCEFAFVEKTPGMALQNLHPGSNPGGASNPKFL